MNCFKKLCGCGEKQTKIKYFRGATGPAGPAGKGLRIDGTVSDVSRLPLSPENGTAYLVGVTESKLLYTFDALTKVWINQGYLKGDKGEKGDNGEKGDKGEAGYSLFSTAFITTLRSPDFVIPNGGFNVPSQGRVPLGEIQESAGEEIVRIDKDQNTIKILNEGKYKVNFILNAYTQISGEQFDLNADFVAVGFRKVDSDEVIAGANDWSSYEVPHNISGQGIFSAETGDEFELVNLHVRPMYIMGGRKEQTFTSSYMITPVMTMIITRVE